MNIEISIMRRHSSSPPIGRLRVLLLATLLAIAGCASAAGEQDGGEPASGAATDAGSDADTLTDGDTLTVVATTTIIGDLVRTVVGDAAEVVVLMEAGTDPHTFSMSARQLADTTQADLVVANGLGLEAGIADSLEQVRAAGVEVVELGPELDPLPIGGNDHTDDDADDHGAEEGDHGDAHASEDDGGHADHDHADEHASEEAGDHADEEAGDDHDGHAGDHDDHDGHDDHADHDDHPDDHDDHAGEEDGHDHGDEDPHVWLDPTRMAEAGDIVAVHMAEVADGPWDDGAAAWREDMAAAHDDMVAATGGIVDECRVIVTGHDAFGYFADLLDFEVVGTIIPSITTEAQASAADLAALIEVVDAHGVQTIFIEDTASTDVADNLSAQLEGVTVTTIPLATLRPEGPETLADLQTHLAVTVADGLAPCSADAG